MHRGGDAQRRRFGGRIFKLRGRFSHNLMQA
jgi:hypothetical protein